VNWIGFAFCIVMAFIHLKEQYEGDSLAAPIWLIAGVLLVK